MRKFILALVLVLCAINIASAQNIQSLDCEKLFDGELVLENEYEELANICFYGTGFSDETVDLKLENGDNSYALEDVNTNNGVISSIAGSIKKFFSDVSAGIYRLIVVMKDGKVEQADEIVVNGEDVQEEPEYNNDEIPEFSTLAAAAALVGAGYYIRKKRFLQ